MKSNRDDRKHFRNANNTPEGPTGARDKMKCTMYFANAAEISGFEVEKASSETPTKVATIEIVESTPIGCALVWKEKPRHKETGKNLQSIAYNRF